MKERPILFSGPMVCAILSGEKTQTRRLVKPQPHDNGTGRWTWVLDSTARKQVGTFCFGIVDSDGDRFTDRGREQSTYVRCPFGRPGDRLWVRETWAELIAVSPATDRPMPIGPGERLIDPPTKWRNSRGQYSWNYDGKVVAYRANSNVEFCDGDGFTCEFSNREDMPKWKPSIHMPRWASRITLEVTGIRVERLQAISDDDADAEGVGEFDGLMDEPDLYRRAKAMGEAAVDPRVWFAQIWDSINGKRAPWDSNPWVWAIAFKRILA